MIYEGGVYELWGVVYSSDLYGLRGSSLSVLMLRCGVVEVLVWCGFGVVWCVMKCWCGLESFRKGFVSNYLIFL